MIGIDLVRTGDNLYALMAEKGMTPNRVAEKLGINHMSAYKWVYGVNLPNIEHLLELSELLEVPIEQMIIYERR